tara:strand:+ start:142 stop:303 length:162 start_codon:yes stop_codon:yes gene_type:complete
MLLVGWVLRFVLHAPYTTIGGDGARLQKGRRRSPCSQKEKGGSGQKISRQADS